MRIKCQLLFLIFVVFSPFAYSAPILVGSGAGGVTGVTGLEDGNGNVWDISFVDGTCTSVYGVCGPSGNVFSTYYEFEAAVVALGEFFEAGGLSFGPTATYPTNTIANGYTESDNGSFIELSSEVLVMHDLIADHPSCPMTSTCVDVATLHTTKQLNTDFTDVLFYQPWTGLGGKFIEDTFDTTNVPSKIWAVYERSTPPIPEPSLLPLFSLGLLGVLLMRRRAR